MYLLLFCMVNLAICQCIFLDVSEFRDTGCILYCINLRLFMMFINYCIMMLITVKLTALKLKCILKHVLDYEVKY